MTKRWTATKSNIQPKRLASKRRRRRALTAEQLADAEREAKATANWFKANPPTEPAS